jgi:hypothetical protein
VRDGDQTSRPSSADNLLHHVCDAPCRIAIGRNAREADVKANATAADGTDGTDKSQQATVRVTDRAQPRGGRRVRSEVADPAAHAVAGDRAERVRRRLLENE